MQQTETYKLNLIESSDPFSPGALNENTRKVEEVLHENLAGLDARVAALELHQVATGWCASSKTAHTVSLGFTPKAVYVRIPSTSNSADYMIIEEHKDSSMYIVEGGFHIASGTFLTNSFNYLAIS